MDDLEVTTVKVHLAVPVRRYEARGRVEGTRYHSIEGPPTVDESTGQGDLNIPRIVPRLSLISGDTPSNRYISIPIAEVTKKDEGYGLTNFVVPSLFLQSSSSLYDVCKEVISKIRETAAYLIVD